MPGSLGTGRRAILPLPDQLERDADNVLRCPVHKDGAVDAPASGTYRVVSASGREMDAGDVTIVDDVAQAIYHPPAATPLEVGWQVQWTLTYGEGETAEVERFRNEALTCRYRLACPISTDDIYKAAPALKSTVAGAITAKTSADHDEQIGEAWLRVQLRIIQDGKRPWLVIGAGSLRMVVLLEALAIIMGSLSQRNQTYVEQAANYKREAEFEWRRVQLKYDLNDDGASDAGRKSAQSGAVWCGGFDVCR